MESIILRFRDLITEESGTIRDHREIIKQYAEVWWGWWMKQYETPPHDVFKKLATYINNNSYHKAYLFNSGSLKLYKTNIVRIAASRDSMNLQSPDFLKSPVYYQRGSYPAWFLLSQIEEVNLENERIKVIGFPTISQASTKQTTLNKGEYRKILNTPLEDLQSLRDTDVTLWEIQI